MRVFFTIATIFIAISNTADVQNQTTTATAVQTKSSLLNSILPNSIEHKDFRRANDKRNRNKKSRRSTSSSSGEKDASNQDAVSGKKESLEMTEDSSIDYSNKKKDKSVKKDKKIHLGDSSEYQDGWRKWHRKCYRCPEIDKKYRDPSIKWICGAYYRARRSFKSVCMMHYRNCQDGTMFVKISDHMCADDDTNHTEFLHGKHFFYEYKALLDSESSKTEVDESDSDSGSVSNTFSVTKDEEERKRNVMMKRMI